MHEAEPQKIDPGEVVQVQWKDIDLMASAFMLVHGEISAEEFNKLPQLNIFEISKKNILDFCGKCSMLGDDGICKLAGLQDQTRYVARNWCGWASVDGVRGEMTSEGFKTHS